MIFSTLDKSRYFPNLTILTNNVISQFDHQNPRELFYIKKYKISVSKDINILSETLNCF